MYVNYSTYSDVHFAEYSEYSLAMVQMSEVEHGLAM